MRTVPRLDPRPPPPTLTSTYFTETTTPQMSLLQMGLLILWTVVNHSRPPLPGTLTDRNLSPIDFPSSFQSVSFLSQSGLHLRRTRFLKDNSSRPTSDRHTGPSVPQSPRHPFCLTRITPGSRSDLKPGVFNLSLQIGCFNPDP